MKRNELPSIRYRNITSGLFLLLISFIDVGCKKSPLCDCFTGTGNTITETRSAAPFHYLELNDKVNINVHRSSDYKITVHAGKKLIDNITTDIENGVLRIENKNKCNWVRNLSNTFEVDIYTPSIDTIEVTNSSGNIYFADTFKCERFQFESWSSTGDYHLKLKCTTGFLALQTGPASLYASGTIGVAYMWNQGQGLFDASSIVADDIYTSNRGMNDQLLHVRNRLYAKVEFSGNIYYKGSPADLKLEDYGSGQIIHQE